MNAGLSAELDLDLQNSQARSQAPSIISLRNPLSSVPATAATSMLTVVPNDDEKVDEQQGTYGEEAGREGNEAAREREQVGEGGGNGAEGETSNIPQVALTFLLVSGSRRTMTFDPELAIGRVKELVWNGWPSEWPDEKPPSPSFLRILYLGKILQDEDTLSKLSFPLSPEAPRTLVPTIVHLSVRPVAPPVDDEATIKKNLRAARRALSRSTSTRAAPTADSQAGAQEGTHSGGCCCVIC